MTAARRKLLEDFHAQACRAYPGTAECARFEQALEAVLAAERERCALECDSFATALDGGDAPISMAATAIACANRLRGLT